MKIVVDENIVHLDVFQNLGELVPVHGREINADILADADALLVRSITKVNEDLLKHSSLKFVASATSGIDHIDTSYLNKQGIAFHYAPGCNARSVVEYVFSAIKCVANKRNINWQKCSVGIIGAGNIGGLLAKVLTSLGMKFSIYDPFLNSGFTFSKNLVSFEEVLKQDILSIHTPLTFDTEYPSHYLFDEKVINSLSPGKIFINAARGGVVDNLALLERLARKDDLYCVLDAWEGEPNVNLELLEIVDIGTPHIAGYSFDGKLRGTRMIYEALCNAFSFDEVSMLEFDAQIQSGLQPTEYDVMQDHAAMQELLHIGKNNEINSKQAGSLFDQLRKNYPIRLEYNFEENHPT